MVSSVGTKLMNVNSPILQTIHDEQEILDINGTVRTSSLVTISYGNQHMDISVLAN